jgi:protein ImuA
MSALPVRPKLDALRRRIETLESKGAPEARAGLVFALGPLTIAPGALHEIRLCEWRDAPAALGFALAISGKIAARTRKPAVWVREPRGYISVGRAYACGLSSFGVDPEDVIVVSPQNAKEALWATEEAAGASGVGAVVSEFLKPHGLLDLTATRRLQLAAEASGTTPIFLRSAGDAKPSAARTRWRIAAAPSASDSYDLKASGNPRWRVELEKCRAGGRGAWVLEWDDETGELREAAVHGRALPEMADRPPEEIAAVA